MTKQATPPPPGDKPTPTAPSPPPRWRHWLWPVAALAAVLLWTTLPNVQDPPKMDLNYSQFLKQVDTGKVKTVTIKTDGQANGTLTNGHRYTVTVPVDLAGPQLLDRLQDKKVTITASSPTPSFGSRLLSWTLILAPFLIIGWLWWRMSKGAMAQMHGALGGVGKSKAKVFDAERPKTGFADVAGYEGVKAEIAEVVDFLRRPERYHRAGASAPRGVLMVGPPGTGKTLLARAVAGEADVPFLSVAGSSFVEMYVGVGAARVRDLFAEARKRAPAIVFVDELDALGGRRTGTGQMVSNDEREQTLNQLLSEMDGFEGAEGIVVLAATNRPEVLDPALLRPGRFDRQVTVPLPTLAERAAILAVHCHSKRLDPDVDLDVVARGTPGFSGADLANLANEAAIAAVRDGREVITADDFDAARDRILLGRREGSNVLLPAEKHAVAVHEAGHALVAALSPSADPVAKVTILPAGQTLGVTEQLPLVERHLYGEDYLTQTLAVRLGGRAAELVELGQGSTGAANDLAGATELATKMVREFGLSTSLGPVGYPQGGSVFLGSGGSALSSRPFAEATQAAIDTEVARLLRDAEQHATGLLEAHRDALRRLVELLLEQETVDGTAVYNLLGTRHPDEHAAGTTMAPRRVSVAKEPTAHRSGSGGPAAPASAGTAPAASKPEEAR
ncbi:ATP-dependent zinc metalloprotease FtsH [Streptomyces albogriseolus]|uniref:ATP-dependent zinc metalloprotease FtsH n=2 Tax=unclassified Streptomyces TaxID=2593676 RepID=V9Z4J2_9ACTN|nr:MULTISPECIES: ATP-dependent zinc metalloprotease FtsH [unclassified Streptomyces]AHE38968.1 ATP-dependent metalloprotease FtsH [Streptomyces sp. FR1]AHE39452.1 ATP-dependent metalloprotease FtsH [Streptomyces sp. F2]